MPRLVVVSNRVAVPTDQPAQAGGLAMALRDALDAKGGVWFGWSGHIAEETTTTPTIKDSGNVTYATLDLGEKDHTEYYNGFANRTLWPLVHYRTDLADFSRTDHAGYLRVNTCFAESLQPLLRPDDIIWVHDYHLIPFASELRRLGVKNRIGFFLHTPFPALEIFTTLPGHQRLGRSLCDYDLIGLQTPNDLRAFLDYAVHEAGGEMIEANTVRCFGNLIRAEVFPIQVDPDALARLAVHGQQEPGVRKFIKSKHDMAFMIGTDRLDYSKGIPDRFRAFERFLEAYPAHHEKVVLMQIAPPSRSEVPEYQAIREELEAEAGRINAQYSEIGWTPIHYLNRGYPRDTLMAFFRSCEVGVVTPLRDGMNLVAKEYVAAQNPMEPGVLVLSRFAGAAHELDGALLVNPADRDGMADAFNRALTMSIEEKQERWQSMMNRLQSYTITNWRDDFLAALDEAPVHP